MNVQNSFQVEDAKLYVVPTPIGNLEDITLRAIKVLQEVDLIAAEDTRNTQKLLNYFDIKKELISYHEHNRREREKQLYQRLENGESIALVSDAGMPAISDPGVELVKGAISKHIDVIVLPGANAALTALVGSGLPTDQFLFYGFLPRKTREKKEVLESLKGIEATLIFYESPYRTKQTLQALYDQLGNRRITIARELTKRFEQYMRGTLQEMIDFCQDQTFKGEICLIVEGGSNKGENYLWWTPLDVKEHVNHYISRGLSSKEAIKKVAVERKMNRKEVYSKYHIH